MPAVYNMENLADFEEIQIKYNTAINSNSFNQLIKLVISRPNLYICANGGLHYVASHMATDLSRLVPEISAHSFDSVGFITSNANDHGYNNIFVRWLEVLNVNKYSENSLIIGLSCSGKSKNVIKAFDWGENNGINHFLISGVKNPNIDDAHQLCFDAHHYHTVEALSLMLFYQMVHSLGFSCPRIG